jgi:hypothetical protein
LAATIGKAILVSYCRRQRGNVTRHFDRNWYVEEPVSELPSDIAARPN